MIDIQLFEGTAPRIQATKLPDRMAQTAENCTFQSGSLEGLYLPLQAQNFGIVSAQTPWKMGSTWITLPTASWAVNSFVSNDNDRFYWTDPATYPKKSDSTLWPASRPLGITPPTGSITLTFDGTAGSDIQDTVSYVYTLVTEWGEESMPSPVSPVVTVYEGQGVSLSGLTTPTTNNVITKKRIYRLSSGTSGAAFQYLDEIGEAVTTYDDFDTDALKAVSTDVLATTYWNPPPNNLTGMIRCHNGIMAGFAGKILYLTEPYAPYAWPEKYQFEFDYPITGIGHFGSTIIVITEQKPWAVLGSTPENMAKTPINYLQSCVSAKSVLGTPDGVLYASPDGLCICNGVTVQVMSAPFITKQQWSALGPDTLKMVKYNSRYYGFFLGSSTGMIYNAPAGSLTTFDLSEDKIQTIQDVLHDGTTNTLYLLTRGSDSTDYLYAFEGGSGRVVYTWKSKQFVKPENYTCAKVEGDFDLGTVTFRYYLNGNLELTRRVSSDQVFRLPSRGYKPKKEIEVEGSIRIDRIRCANSPKDFRGE